MRAVLTAQKRQPRVQVSPRSMMVAVAAGRVQQVQRPQHASIPNFMTLMHTAYAENARCKGTLALLHVLPVVRCCQH